MNFFRALLFTFLFARAHILAAGLHPSLPAIGSLDGLGVNIHFTDPKPGELEMIKAAGFKWVRMDLGWGATERKAGEYDFSAYDRLVSALEKQGIRAVFILDYGNPLYAEPGDKHPFTSRANTPEFRDAFARWAAAAVKHFSGKGFLWEIWNEPNHTGFWKPKPDVQSYIALAKAAGAAIRAAAPKEAVIGPATSTIDLPFLESCMQAGLLEIFDGVSVHPYRQTSPETVEEEYRSVRLLIRKYAPKDKAIPVLSGEWGYSDAWPNCGFNTGHIAEQFLTNIANDIPLSIWYDWRDDGLDPKNAEHNFGIVEHEFIKDGKLPFKPKCAYEAAKMLTEQLRGFRFNKRLIVNSSNPDLDSPSRVLLFSRNETEQKLAVYWTGDSRDSQIDIPASHGLFQQYVVNRSGEIAFTDRSAVAAGDKGIHLDAASFGIKYLTPEKPNDFLRLSASSPKLPLEYIFHWPEELKYGPNREPLNGLRYGIVNRLRKPVTIHYGFSSPTSRLRPGEDEVWHIGVGDAGSARRMARQYVDGDSTVEMPNGQILVLRQRCRLVCTNPIDVELLPSSAKAVTVRVFNPSGEAAAMEVATRGEIVPLAFESGQLEKVVRIPFEPDNKEAAALKIVIGQQHDDGVQNTDRPIFERDFGKWVHLPDFKASGLKVQADGDQKTSADIVLDAASDSSFGFESPAIKLTYKFGAGWKFVQLHGSFSPIQVAKDDPLWPRKLGIWLRGDGKGCQTRMRFKDAAGQTFQSNGPKIDWTGWRHVTFALDDPDQNQMTYWGGPKDGKIYHPIQLDSVFLLDNVGREQIEGEILLSGPALIYEWRR